MEAGEEASEKAIDYSATDLLGALDEEVEEILLADEFTWSDQSGGGSRA